MSVLRELRFLIARHLSVSPRERAAILDVLNLIDADLDTQGYDPPSDVHDALRRLEKATIEYDPEDPEGLLDMEDDTLSSDFIDIDELTKELEENDDE